MLDVSSMQRETTIELATDRLETCHSVESSVTMTRPCTSL